MRKTGMAFIFFCVIAFQGWGQISVEKIVELKNQLHSASHDTIRLKLYFNLASGYRFSNIDSSNFYADQALKLADKLNIPSAKSRALITKSSTALESGNLPQSFQYAFEALRISEKIKDYALQGSIFNRIGNIYMELADYRKAIEYYTLSKEQYIKVKRGNVLNEISNIGNVYELMGMADSALYYQKIVYDSVFKHTDRNRAVQPEIMFRMGNAYKLKGDNNKALSFYRKGIDEAKIDNDLRNLAMNNLFIAKLYFEMNLTDSSMRYASNAMEIAKTIYFKKVLYEASLLVSEIFKTKKDYESAYSYLTLANVQRDSLTGAKKLQDLQRIILNEQERQQKENEKKIEEQNRNRQVALLIGAAVLLFIALVFYRNNRQKQKANKVLETTLINLKSTQAQLIQSEKMASLGELTAGIAHEIQNPLNFVNNFSEVNKELLFEMKDEIDKGNIKEAKSLADDLIDNQEKINHHGKRADAIVKGMLQHSRASSGKKEPTDINALCDEYLRLSYHGLRAKDKTFNATIKTDLDPSIEKIKIIPQEIGRVILNLLTNAFYVVHEKKKLNIDGYEPTVSISTKKISDKVEIRVTDNGNGIPQKVLDKIFQPFFTTKPTGQGTGLGLSLSYDIIKAHGGELKVNTTEGEGSEFILQLLTN